MTTIKDNKKVKTLQSQSKPPVKKNMAYEKLRVAAYPSPQLLTTLDKFCQERNIDRNSAINLILRVMLNVNDESEITQLAECLSMFEEQIRRVKIDLDVSDQRPTSVTY
jgi:hypothetical protein